MCCRHFSTMHLLFGCIMLIVTTEVTSSLSNTQNDSIKMQDILHETEDSLFQNEFDSNSFQEKSKKEMRTFDIVFDYIVREITSISNFPTLVARNISEQCRNDTRDFRAAKFKFTDWAMKSKFSMSFLLSFKVNFLSPSVRVNWKMGRRNGRKPQSPCYRFF